LRRAGGRETEKANVVTSANEFDESAAVCGGKFWSSTSTPLMNPSAWPISCAAVPMKPIWPAAMPFERLKLRIVGPERA
jgi:hypothetical protein